MREMPRRAQKGSQGGDRTEKETEKPKNRKHPQLTDREKIRGSRKKKKAEARNFEARFHIQKPAVFTPRLDIEAYA